MTAGPDERIMRVAHDLWGLANDLAQIANVNGHCSKAYCLALRECSNELKGAVELWKAEQRKPA